MRSVSAPDYRGQQPWVLGAQPGHDLSAPTARSVQRVGFRVTTLVDWYVSQPVTSSSSAPEPLPRGLPKSWWKGGLKIIFFDADRNLARP